MMPNVTDAKKYLSGMAGFTAYSSAYVMTNEELRHALKDISSNTKNALTVVGSGDHPMFTKLYGAKDIDTFDISYNAKLVMDIKTTALSVLDYPEYCRLLVEMAKVDVKNVKSLPLIADLLPNDEKLYLQQMKDFFIFRHEKSPEKNKALPTKNEFIQMRKTITKPFNFIWTDVCDLHKKLTKKYDFIHLSNVFDYLPIGTSVDVLYRLCHYTNPGAIICMVGFVRDVRYIYNQITDEHSRNNTGQIWKCCELLSSRTCLLFRVR